MINNAETTLHKHRYLFMLPKILIANRGAIAVRIIRTLKTMGIASVAVYSEADADSLHVRHADEAFSLGAGAAAATYLDQEKILSIAKQTGAKAIHPGYGFLSENASFVERCEALGIIFLGPTTQQMNVFGLKHTARALAEDNQVPLLPGTDLLQDKNAALQAASEVGYPIMLKSTAGGGGIGMQRCYNAQELDEAFESVKRLSGNNFSNDGVFIEKFVEAARHIEVQVFGDGCGQVIALGERDCSAQRRNQKVIEETPAPNLSEQTRSQLQQVAKDLLAAVNYRSAGTVEFILDQETEQFYFLEVNTRLQVEHGVTEEVYGVDIVKWMVELGSDTLAPLDALEQQSPLGHAIQIRLYAENPHKDFQPSAGLLTKVEFPQVSTAKDQRVRIDHWVESGVEISPFFDPMLGKIICWAPTRDKAIALMDQTISDSTLYGIATNLDYTQAVIRAEQFKNGELTTRSLNDFNYQPNTVDVLRPGTLTTLQDYPGRTGYWDIGVPPSGPFDHWALQLANQYLGNAADAASLEITLNGPKLQFNSHTQIIITGADFSASIDDVAIALWQVVDIKPGQILSIDSVQGGGARCYLSVSGGWQCPDYLGSKSTFTLGQFGGHNGRALRLGDVLQLQKSAGQVKAISVNPALIPSYDHQWEINVIYGPHGAPDFFSQKDIDTFFDNPWEVHYNSSRTGIRLIGPKPEWARSDGGEAGMHPSNIHDNAYAIGTVDFTGDMPVILGPDGPSLGGFVCPATVITADLWKLGQLKAGDKIRFKPVSIETAVALEHAQQQSIANLESQTIDAPYYLPDTPIIKKLINQQTGVDVVYRPSGDHYLLVEYGELVLDIDLRFRVHALMLHLNKLSPTGMLELTPGIRSLQIHYNSQQLALNDLLALLTEAEDQLGDCQNLTVPTRTVHLPLSWDDEVCQQAIKKYDQSVRKNAPWAPSNLEFIRRINGLESIDAVKDIVFNASYLVMGLGDVYLGAPVATPLDPRHRLVTTKYNPARTWTAENSVGIGGSYLCIYGMEGPGGYQFVGRTLQMWNRYRQTKEFTKPWLLRFFDQIKFYEVSQEELKDIRKGFVTGAFDSSPIKIEESSFSLQTYKQFLRENQTAIDEFTSMREQAFDEELKRWNADGQFHYEVEVQVEQKTHDNALAANEIAIESHVAGNIWQTLVKKDDPVKKGQPLMIIESMKMEIEIFAEEDGIVSEVLCQDGDQVSAGKRLLVIETL